MTKPSPVPADIAGAKYISFVSHRRDGTAVATPVWVVPFEDGIAFTTEAEAHKVKRVRRDPRVTVAVCDYGGTVPDGAARCEGRAEILDPDRARKVERLINRKYPIANRALSVLALWRRIRRKPDPGDGAIKVVFGPL